MYSAIALKRFRMIRTDIQAFDFHNNTVEMTCEGGEFAASFPARSLRCHPQRKLALSVLPSLTDLTMALQ